MEVQAVATKRRKTAKRDKRVRSFERKEPATSSKLKREAAIGLRHPERLTKKQEQSLAGSVARHIEPRRTRKRVVKRSSSKRRTTRR